MVALREGDERALDELYRRYQRPLFGFAYRYLGNPEAAMDTVQETFVRVHRSRTRYRPSASFASWIYRILRNLCIDEKRRYWNRHVLRESQLGTPGEEGPGIIADTAGESRTGADEIFEKQVTERIREAIDTLSPDQKEVMVLNKYQGLSYKEIGEILGISSESVKQRAYRAHLRLRDLLQDLVD